VGGARRGALARTAPPGAEFRPADEPTGALEGATGGQIRDLLMALQSRQGATLILVTHAPELAARCDREIRLRDGRLDHDAQAAAAE